MIQIKGGLSYKSKYVGEGEAQLLGMGCVSFNERFLHAGVRAYSGSFNDNHLIEPGEIVLATRQQSENLPILGFPAMIPQILKNKEVIVGTNLYKVYNESILSNSILFQLFKSKKYQRHIKSNSKGTTVRMITKDSVESFEFKMPSTDNLEKLHAILKSIDVKIEKGLEENMILRQTRDTLLPKLMTGQIELA